ncbi:MAG: tetratricopeptide repeat protein [Calditrichaeota bacterium]|nr:tetratricopeptide repeat protein [Calditrichota bacterium]MCB9391992.1 tetratricopeptide repeat protein [Calditrichota bacterium]
MTILRSVMVVVLFLGGVCGKSIAQQDISSPALEQFIRGTTASEQGNAYEACFYFEEAIRLDKQAPFLYVALAEQYVVLAQQSQFEDTYDRAFKSLDQALELDPDYLPALELKGRILALRGKVEEARGVAEGLVSRDPANREYKFDLLTLSLSTGEFDRADEMYAQLSPDSAPIFDLTRQVVAIYLMSGENSRALPYVETLATEDSSDAAVVYTLSTLYLQTGDTARAIEEVDRALDIDSTQSRAWYLKAVIEFDRERYPEVLALAETARVVSQEDARTANLEGLSNIKLGDTTAAIERFLRAVEIDSTLFPSAGSLGMLYDARDSLELSVHYYEQAIELSDSAAVYLNNLAYAYAVRGIELGKALKLVEGALAREPENASYLDTKGWILHKEGAYDEALVWLRKAHKKDRESAPILEHIGDVYDAMGRTSQARKYWKQAQEVDPGLTSLQEKLGQ